SAGLWEPPSLPVSDGDWLPLSGAEHAARSIPSAATPATRCKGLVVRIEHPSLLSRPGGSPGLVPQRRGGGARPSAGPFERTTDTGCTGGVPDDELDGEVPGVDHLGRRVPDELEQQLDTGPAAGHTRDL